ncbi:MAG: folate family ECF transporter S component [Clostridia bacterium]|nr:folate family ECF transporter S component [Clostridia bacterium]
MLVTTAMLVAVEIILNRFLSINAWNIKIGFSFVPIVIAAILYGPVTAGVVGALGDFIGALLFPIGAYFPGFTATAFLMGVVFGLFLHKEQSLKRTVQAVLINQFILGLFVNSFWISILYGSPYGPLLVTRVVQAALLTVVQIVTTQAIIKVIPRFRKSNLV